ncbi:unnamed protein product, partial [Ectocarpus sp. 12 AP-2014]
GGGSPPPCFTATFAINHVIYLVNKHKQQQHYNSSKDDTLRGHHPMRSNLQPRLSVPNIPPPQPTAEPNIHVHHQCTRGDTQENTFPKKRVRAPKTFPRPPRTSS